MPYKDPIKRKMFEKEYHSRPDVKNKKIWSQVKHNYGITREEFDSILELQQGKCSICGKDRDFGNGNRLCIDHDHNTKRVRGLLCNDCNQLLGRSKDNIDILYKAVEYLNKWK